MNHIELQVLLVQKNFAVMKHMHMDLKPLERIIKPGTF